MKRAFTLVEMLIVVAVLVTLMTITFRLSSIGDDQSRRNSTIARLQRLENCLSGYYAAFGTYPPVKLHGSHNVFLQVDNHGFQDVDGQENAEIWNWYKETGDHGLYTTEESRAWRQVQAACKAQPVDCRFPFPDGYRNAVKAISAEIARRASSNDPKYKSYYADPELQKKLATGFVALGAGEGVDGSVLNKAGSDSDWREVQIFKFGLMSYLLPRYLVMMNGRDEFFDSTCRQWNDSNQLPCDAMDGSRFANWRRVKQYADDTQNGADRARVANIPSQAVCARWMPNLENICACGHQFRIFGVDIKSNTSEPTSLSPSSEIEIYSPNGNGAGGYSDQYVLDGISVMDGWHNDFYYYSPPPYQSYVLWSSGPNGRTFPPWVDRSGMSSAANRCIGVWTADDIIHMSN